jgi:hypothetical protein
MVEMANDKQGHSMVRQQQVYRELQLLDNSYTYMGWFAVYAIKWFNKILRNSINNWFG